IGGISGFSVFTQPNNFPIPAGFSTTFRLQFEPTTDVTRAARVFIFSNADNTVGPFDFTLRGEGFEDCNENDEPDAEDIANGLEDDCNFNDIPDVCEDDTDGDGFIDGCDECPGEDDLLDTDGDDVADCLDNCPDDANADQLDSDNNGLGDACEEEEIVDCNSNGVADELDVIDETSYDCNTNGTPDECEVLADTDGDTVADGCDLCPGEDDLADSDGDEYPDCLDNCPETSNPDQLDSDSNGLGDACKVEEEEPVVCTDEYLPVCGMNGMTYDNACYADEAGMNVAYEGECTPPEFDEECTDEFEPVCGMNGMTYGNACYADQAGMAIAHEGACEVLAPPGDEDEIGDDEEVGDDGDVEVGDEDKIGDDGKIGDEDENTGETGDNEAGRETGQEDNNTGGGSAGMCGAGGLGMLPLIVLGLCGLKLGAAGRSRRSFTTVTR
ncbi:MAG: hypothetical protein GY778_16125, partial [bacterium]|nr:hypothetical protein [bacterium]